MTLTQIGISLALSTQWDSQGNQQWPVTSGQPYYSHSHWYQQWLLIPKVVLSKPALTLEFPSCTLAVVQLRLLTILQALALSTAIDFRHCETPWALSLALSAARYIQRYHWL